MVLVQRSGRSEISCSDTTTRSSTARSPESDAQEKMHLRPSKVECIILTLFPFILLLGSIFSVLDPASRHSPYDPISQSHVPDQAPSYFALKKNVVNRYFVKINWLWITISYFVFIFRHGIISPKSNADTSASDPAILTSKCVQGLVRYSIITSWWFLVTQWFFGPALIDRGFRLTGGACQIAQHFEGSGGKRELITGQACKLAGGTWRGGHDISGHVFILVLGSAFLLLENASELVRIQRKVNTYVAQLLEGAGAKQPDAGNMSDGPATNNVSSSREFDRQKGSHAETYLSWPPLSVAGLNCFMLFMTAAYFHTWFEKLTGLLVALAGLFVVYFLPRLSPQFGAVIGFPCR